MPFDTKMTIAEEMVPDSSDNFFSRSITNYPSISLPKVMSRPHFPKIMSQPFIPKPDPSEYTVSTLSQSMNESKHTINDIVLVKSGQNY